MGKSSWKFAFVTVFCLISSLIVLYQYALGGSRSFVETTIPADGYDLFAMVSKSDKSTRWVVFTHGNRKAGQNHPLYRSLLNNIGDETSILALDFRGFGKSAEQNLSSENHILNRSYDIDAAVNYIKLTYGVKSRNIVLIGHSLGSLMVLKAASRQDYKMVIPIGPTDFNVFIENKKRMKAYLSKFQRNTGILMSESKFIEEGKRLTPQSLFKPCPNSPITLVFGEYDYPDTLIHRKNSISDSCLKKLNWKTIKFSNHMYNTESRSIFRFGSQALAIAMLSSTIKQLIVH